MLLNNDEKKVVRYSNSVPSILLNALKRSERNMYAITIFIRFAYCASYVPKIFPIFFINRIEINYGMKKTIFQ